MLIPTRRHWLVGPLFAMPHLPLADNSYRLAGTESGHFLDIAVGRRRAFDKLGPVPSAYDRRKRGEDEMKRQDVRHRQEGNLPACS